MSSQDIQNLEAYLFAEDKQTFLSKLVPHSESHIFFTLLHSLQTNTKVAPEVEAQIKEYIKSTPSRDARCLHIKSLLKKFDDPSAKDAEKNEVITHLLNQYLHFNFNYSKPSDITTSALSTDKKQLPSKLDAKTVLLESKLENVYKSLHEFNQIQPEAYSRLDTKKIQDGDLQVFERFVFSALPTDFEDFPKLILELMKKKKTETYYVRDLLRNLSLEQLHGLAQLNPNFTKDSDFVQELCKKEFNISNLYDLGTGLSKPEKRDLVLKLYIWAKKQQTPFTSLTSNALYEILQLDLEMNKFDKDLFVEYLRNPVRNYPYISEKHKKSLNARPLTQNISIGSERINSHELIKRYLEEFFAQAKDTQPFTEYIDSRYLNEVFYSTKLMLGQQVEVNQALTPDQLKKLAESKEITICSYNKEFYKGSDSVTLQVRIKNIPSLMVKVFEFKSENYYLKTYNQLDGSINLDGLVAAEETNYDFKEAPIRRFVHTFNFESISKKKQGIFIVDFIGNGLSSRAVIRKGKLAHFEQQTVAGQLFTLIDDETNICNDGRTGIWIKDHFYKADEKGRILIPFGSSRNEKAVLVHNDFAELTDIQLKQETFEFKCAYIYNYETFLMGNQAKILVQPRLFLNSQPVGLEVMKECSAVVTTVNEDGVPSKTPFDKLKFSATQDLELEFSVPAKLRQISVEVTGKITPINKREPVPYTSYHQVQVDANNGSNIFCNLYLRYAKNGYEVLVLGKNGEPKQNLTINFSFQNKYLTQKIHQTLQTDPQGRIHLGKLEEVNFIEANLQPFGDIGALRRTWNVNNQKTVNYPHNVRICEGDSITFPLLHNELNRHQISFVKTLEDGTILQNQLKSLKIDSKKLIISGLTEGTYQLALKDVNHDVQITVFKGTYWDKNPGFLHTKNSLLNIKKETNNIVITDIQVQPKASSDVAELTIQSYVDEPKFARFHVFGVQFLESDVNRLIRDLENNLPEDNPTDAFLGLKKSQYLNNRSLGDEYCYVLDRRNKSRYLGNTLEKPQVLLKRTFVRETQTNEEQLAQNQEFDSAPVEEEKESRAVMYKSKKKMDVAKKEKAYDKADGGFARAPMSRVAVQEVINNSPNFLTNASLIYSNLQVDAQGKITIPDFPYKKYSMLQIVATNLASNICQTFPLDSVEVPAKDLRQQARAKDSVFAINRVSKNILKGETEKINDLTSTEIQVIDSIPKLFDIQKNLILSANNSHISPKFQSWEFLKEWESLSAQEKLRKYDKFASHELNLFVYFKDREFFTQTVLPFLHNKIEKSFVDYFLLDDKRQIQEYAGAQRFKDLNSLEKILLIIKVQNSDPAQAKRLVESLENKNSLEKVDVNTFNKYFDTILTSKKTEEEKAYEKSFAADAVLECAQVMPVAASFNYAPPGARMMMASASVGNSFGAARGMKAGGARGGRGGSRAVVEKKLARAESESDEEEEGEEEMAYYEDDDAGEYLSKRERIQAGFQELEKTKEYTERHYFEVVGKTVHIPLNKFWVDVAQHIVENGLSKPLLTQNFIYSHSSLTELIATLALLSLPFKPKAHSYTNYEGRGLQIEAASDFIIFTKAVAEADSDLKGEILIIQRFFDVQDRYTESEEEPGLQVEKEVDQYIINKIYGSTVIVTNSSSSRQQLQVLIEVPEGAIPVNSLDYTKSHNITLNAFSTQTIEFFFYFPQVGKFKVNPPNVSKRGKVVAVGKVIEVEVKLEKIYATLETLSAVLTKGSQEDVLNFARTKNIWNRKVFDFNAIYWLLLEKNFFLKFIEILRERKYYDPIVWQFGFHHKDIRTIKEYFAAHPENRLAQETQYLSSSILEVDKLQLLEYNPFINQRVHLLADSKNRILNVQLKEQYKKFVLYLCERGQLSAEHYLGLIYYLLLQDRVEEAIQFFGKINREELRKNHQHELQYDYLSAYLDFYIGYPNFSVARETCQKYLQYPVLSWRSLFVEVSNQLAEFDGKGQIEDEVTKNTEKRLNQDNAQKEEVANIEVKDNKLLLTHQNVREITLAFYRIDLEVLFSRNPFITQSKDEFSFIQPSEIEKVNIQNPQDLQKLTLEIPQKLQRFNLHIELRTEEKRLSATYFSTSLKVHILENYGQVKVLDVNDKPLIKVNFF